MGFRTPGPLLWIRACGEPVYSPGAGLDAVRSKILPFVGQSEIRGQTVQNFGQEFSTPKSQLIRNEVVVHSVTS